MAAIDKLERKYIGTRVGFSLLTVLCYFGTLAAVEADPALNTEEVWSTMRWVIGALSVAIIGDTARPSGKGSGAFVASSRPLEP